MGISYLVPRLLRALYVMERAIGWGTSMSRSHITFAKGRAWEGAARAIKKFAI